MATILVTGGHGFIGSNFILNWLKKNPRDLVVNVDALTYAARPAYLKREFEKPEMMIECMDSGFLPPRDAGSYREEIVDIRDQAAVQRTLNKYKPSAIFHLAAESHVCRSIAGPKAFIDTNIVGTWNLLEEARHLWGNDSNTRFVMVSTDEVYGELPLDRPDLKFHEGLARAPRSPYAASKASADLLALSYFHTYGLKVMVTNCTNNYGPNQHTEKLIPRTLQRLLDRQPVIVHGKGDHVRDWLYVDDHCSALESVAKNGTPGETYCIGGENERSNLTVIYDVIAATHKLSPLGADTSLSFSDDRPTDDERYAVDNSKIRALGWAPSKDYAGNIEKTIAWYLKEGFV